MQTPQTFPLRTNPLLPGRAHTRTSHKITTHTPLAPRASPAIPLPCPSLERIRPPCVCGSCIYSTTLRRAPNSLPGRTRLENPPPCLVPCAVRVTVERIEFEWAQLIRRSTKHRKYARPSRTLSLCSHAHVHAHPSSSSSSLWCRTFGAHTEIEIKTGMSIKTPPTTDHRANDVSAYGTTHPQRTHSVRQPPDMER